MKQSYLQVFDVPSDKIQTFGFKVGCATYLLSLSNYHRKYLLKYLHFLLKDSIHQNNIKFYFGMNGEPTGYVVWAYLTEQVQTRIIESGQLYLHRTEWNEGDIPWIIDIISYDGKFMQIIDDICKSESIDKRNLSYVRRKRGEFCIKKTNKMDRAVMRKITSIAA